MLLYVHLKKRMNILRVCWFFFYFTKWKAAFLWIRFHPEVIRRSGMCVAYLLRCRQYLQPVDTCVNAVEVDGGCTSLSSCTSKTGEKKRREKPWIRIRQTKLKGCKSPMLPPRFCPIIYLWTMVGLSCRPAHKLLWQRLKGKHLLLRLLPPWGCKKDRGKWE